MSDIKAQQLDQYIKIKDRTKIDILGSKGAQKPDTELSPEINRAIKVAAANKFQAVEYKSLADVDTLTHIGNRFYFNRVLESEIAQYNRNGIEFGLISGDVRGLKDPNDSYGHAFGDKVLQEISNALKENSRDEDAACHISGDEYAVILPDINPQADQSQLTPKDAVAHAALRLNSSVDNISIQHEKGVYHPHLDIGALVSIPGKDSKQLQVIADNAMYFAKITNRISGKNDRVVIASLHGDEVIYELASLNNAGKILYINIENTDEILEARRKKLNQHV